MAAHSRPLAQCAPLAHSRPLAQSHPKPPSDRPLRECWARVPNGPVRAPYIWAQYFQGPLRKPRCTIRVIRAPGSSRALCPGQALSQAACARWHDISGIRCCSQSRSNSDSGLSSMHPLFCASPFLWPPAACRRTPFPWSFPASAGLAGEGGGRADQPTVRPCTASGHSELA